MSVHDVMGEAAREAVLAITVAADAARLFDGALSKLQTESRTTDPASREGQSLDAMMLCLARARNALHEAVRQAPLTAWQFILERSRRECVPTERAEHTDAEPYAVRPSGLETLVHEGVGP